MTANAVVDVVGRNKRAHFFPVNRHHSHTRAHPLHSLHRDSNGNLRSLSVLGAATREPNLKKPVKVSPHRRLNSAVTKSKKKKKRNPEPGSLVQKRVL